MKRGVYTFKNPKVIEAEKKQDEANKAAA